MCIMELSYKGKKNTYLFNVSNLKKHYLMNLNELDNV